MRRYAGPPPAFRPVEPGRNFFRTRPSMGDLEGKAALVTGAAAGIGLATVELFARRGAKVALNHLPDDSRGPQAVERLRAACVSVIAAPGDVSKAGVAETMTRNAIEAFGRLDFLVNNAGTSA